MFFLRKKSKTSEFVIMHFQIHFLYNSLCFVISWFKLRFVKGLAAQLKDNHHNQEGKRTLWMLIVTKLTKEILFFWCGSEVNYGKS